METLNGANELCNKLEGLKGEFYKQVKELKNNNKKQNKQKKQKKKTGKFVSLKETSEYFQTAKQ